MDTSLVARVVLPLLLVTFAAVLLWWPVARLRRETGAQAITLHRETAPGQRTVAIAFLALQIGVVALVAVYAVGGPDAVGLWRVPAAVVWLGLGLAVAALALVSVAQRQMGASFRIGIDDQRTPLVATGLFRAVRNPIYTGMLLALGGVALAAPCTASALLWIGALLTIARQARLEEAHLLAMHGDAYRAYASRVGRFLPGIGRLR